MNKKVLIFPETLSKYQTMIGILRELSYTPIYNCNDNDYSDYAFCIAYSNSTNPNFKSNQKLIEISKHLKVLNGKINTISKTYVDKIHKIAFGYSTIINPKTYQGLAVKKSIFNATHDGVVIKCPYDGKLDNDKIFQINIDNTDPKYPNYYIDYRLYILNKKMICVSRILIKFRFLSGHPDYLGIPDEFFSKTEIDKINKFCELFEVDYAELDLVRDINTKLIYILDVNTTPGSYHSWFGNAYYPYRQIFQKKINALFIKEFDKFVKNNLL